VKCILVTHVCVSVPHRIPALLHGPGCNLGNGRGCPLVVNYWADLQSVHGFRCYDNIAPNAKCQRVLVLAVCLVTYGRHNLLSDVNVHAFIPFYGSGYVALRCVAVPRVAQSSELSCSVYIINYSLN